MQKSTPNFCFKNLLIVTLLSSMKAHCRKLLHWLTCLSPFYVRNLKTVIVEIVASQTSFRQYCTWQTKRLCNSCILTILWHSWYLLCLYFWRVQKFPVENSTYALQYISMWKDCEVVEYMLANILAQWSLVEFRDARRFFSSFET